MDDYNGWFIEGFRYGNEIISEYTVIGYDFYGLYRTGDGIGSGIEIEKFRFYQCAKGNNYNKNSDHVDYQEGPHRFKR